MLPTPAALNKMLGSAGLSRGSLLCLVWIEGCHVNLFVSSLLPFASTDTCRVSVALTLHQLSPRVNLTMGIFKGFGGCGVEKPSRLKQRLQFYSSSITPMSEIQVLLQDVQEGFTILFLPRI